MEITEDKYSKAYVEILEVIRCMGKEYEDKIPKKILKLFVENKDKDYQYHIDNSKDLKEQKLLEETLGILSVIELKYWATVEEKEKLEKALKENEEKYQCELRERYNPDNIFKNTNIAINNERSVDNLLMIKNRESLFARFINRIRIFLANSNKVRLVIVFRLNNCLLK